MRSLLAGVTASADGGFKAGDQPNEIAINWKPSEELAKRYII